MRLNAFSRLALFVVGVVVLVTGCAPEKERICRQSGSAEICLVGGHSSYKIEGHGFQPQSKATMALDDVGRPLEVLIDADGRVAQQGQLIGVAAGPDPQQVTITGIAAGGARVQIELTVPSNR